MDKIARESDSEAKDDKFDIQNKGSFKKDSAYFLYTLDQDRSIKKTAEKFLKNRQAKTQLFNMFTKLDREKSILKGKKIIAFKPLKKYKNSTWGPRLIGYEEKNQKFVVVGFCVRNNLKKLVDKFKNKYK